MVMTYSEPQTRLFPHSYVNLVHAKDSWKTDRSQHNTHCDVTVVMYAHNIKLRTIELALYAS